MKLDSTITAYAAQTATDEMRRQAVEETVAIVKAVLEQHYVDSDRNMVARDIVEALSQSLRLSLSLRAETALLVAEDKLCLTKAKTPHARAIVPRSPSCS